jgi:hypothetical protein
MIYFSGFSLRKEEALFKDYLIDSEFAVAGFSYGAIKAFDYVYNSSTRIDRLILLSPAFFQNHKKSFIRTQLRYFKSNRNLYIEQFLKNVAYPSNINLSEYLDIGTYNELKYLLFYVWDCDKFTEIINRGVTIEIFIGEDDIILNSKESFKFFSKVTTTYLLKKRGHLLLAL